MENENIIKSLELILNNPANILTETSKDLLETTIRSIKLKEKSSVVISKKDFPKENDVLKTIFDNVSIRGIELSLYSRNFSNSESGLYDNLKLLFYKHA